MTLYSHPVLVVMKMLVPTTAGVFGIPLSTPRNAIGRPPSPVESQLCNGWPVSAFRTYTFVTFALDGRTLATRADDGTAKLWDFESRLELAKLTGHSPQR